MDTMKTRVFCKPSLRRPSPTHLGAEATAIRSNHRSAGKVAGQSGPSMILSPWRAVGPTNELPAFSAWYEQCWLLSHGARADETATCALAGRRLDGDGVRDGRVWRQGRVGKPGRPALGSAAGRADDALADDTLPADAHATSPDDATQAA